LDTHSIDQASHALSFFGASVAGVKKLVREFEVLVGRMYDWLFFKVYEHVHLLVHVYNSSITRANWE
jgi:hypothetical protein